VVGLAIFRDVRLPLRVIFAIFLEVSGVDEHEAVHFVNTACVQYLSFRRSSFHFCPHSLGHLPFRKTAPPELERALTRLSDLAKPLQLAEDDLVQHLVDYKDAGAADTASSRVGTRMYRQVAQLHLDCLQAPLTQRKEAVTFSVHAVSLGQVYHGDDTVVQVLSELVKDLALGWCSRDSSTLIIETFNLYPLLFAIHPCKEEDERYEPRLRIMNRLNLPPLLSDNETFEPPLRGSLTPPFSNYFDLLDLLRFTSEFQHNLALYLPLLAAYKADHKLVELEKEAQEVVLDVVILRTERQRWVRKVREKRRKEEKDRM
jgi:hypothetical protein